MPASTERVLLHHGRTSSTTLQARLLDAVVDQRDPVEARRIVQYPEPPAVADGHYPTCRACHLQLTRLDGEPVSYTHLTLPTILRV